MIQNRGNGSWRIGFQVKTPEGWKWVRETVHVDPALSEAKQKKDAQLALDRMRIEVEDGDRPVDPQRFTVREWSEKWLALDVDPILSPVTASGYRYLLSSRILPMLGDVKLQDLTPLMIAEWVAAVRASPRKTTRKPDSELTHKRSPADEKAMASDAKRKKPLSEKTVQNYFSCLDDMLASAVTHEVLRKNPADKVKRPKKKKPKVKWLSEEQAVALLRCLSDEDNMCYRAGLLLALLCGLRLGEVGDLKLSDVNWKNETIDISRALKYTSATGTFVGDPKSDESNRIIALPHGMMVVLTAARDYQEECKRLIGDLWVGQGWIVHGWDGHRLHHDTLTHWFRAFADAHGYEGIRFHDLRHTHATILLANNIDVVSVAHRLGHSDPSVTLRNYAHALDRRDVESARTFDALISGVELPLPELPRPTRKEQK